MNTSCVAILEFLQATNFVDCCFRCVRETEKSEY